MLDLQGKTVVITAGASVMAQHIARAMADRGANLVIADIDIDAATKAAHELPSAVPARCDVRSTDDVDALRDTTIAAFGPADMVLSHAGVASAGQITDYSDEDWSTLLDLNVIGMARVVRAFLPDMLTRGSGHFVLTSSSLALFHGHPVAAISAPYITTKAAVIGLAQSLETTYAGRGIKTTVFAPDATETRWAPAPVAGADMPALRQVLESIPRYPRQTPEHAAETLMTALDAGTFLAAATTDAPRLLRQQADGGLDPAAMASAYVVEG